MPPPDPDDRRRDHEHEHEVERRLARLERGLVLVLKNQHRDHKLLRELLLRVKQIQDQDGEAVTFELTASTPTENK